MRIVYSGLIFLAFVIFFSLNSIAQNDINTAYFLTQEGSKSKIGHFNHRQRPMSYTVLSVLSVEPDEDAKKIKLNVSQYDKFDNYVSETIFHLIYRNGEVLIPGSYLFSQELPDYQISEASEMRSRDFIIPAFLGNGMNLKPAFAETETVGNQTIKVTDFGRTVDNFEKIDTKAGVFDACVISSKREITNGETEVYTVYSWYSKGVGPVLTRYYNDKRKLVRYSEIVELNIP